MCAKTHDFGLSRGSKPNGGFKSNNGSRNNNHGGSFDNTGRGSGFNSNRGNFNKNIPAPSAPYNFVKLNDRIVEPPLAAKLKEKSYADFIKEDGKYSGYFEVEIKNSTALYIAGVNGFFSNGSRLCIPGSSLRGCLKNTFKIITNSAFRSGRDNPDLTDKRLYYRSFASAFHPLRDLYSQKMSKFTGKIVKGKKICVSIAEGGFLVRKDKKYYICPAKLESINYPYTMGKNRKGEDIRIYHPTCYDCRIWSADYVDVHTGKMDGKGHFYRFSEADWNTLLEIPENIINDYKDDKNRKGRDLLKVDKREKVVRGSLLQGSGKYDFIAPCFYVADGKLVRHFGAGPYYRIPYNKSIGEHIPAEINQDSVVDFTDAIFGNKEEWSSRIFFDDLYLEGQPKIEKLEFHKILSSPNPTSFQFYLEPNGSEAAHWESNTNLRGYKMYWHRNVAWQETDPKKQNEKMTSKFAPLAKDNVFKGRIRFENLDAIELGAVCALFALGNEKNIAYKLGMGKPIGMGTVKLAGKLHLQSADYYQKLFDKQGFAEGTAEASMDGYVAEFNKYMEEKISAISDTSLLLYKARMKELRLIMDTNRMEQPNWADKTRYMEIGRRDKDSLNRRLPLPSIEDVVK